MAALNVTEDLTQHLRAVSTVLAAGVVMNEAPGCGRLLRTERSFEPLEQLLVAPRALRSCAPTRSGGNDCPCVGLAASHRELERLCAEHVGTFRIEIYWAALGCLVSADVPLVADSGWALPPLINEETQASLLRLSCPPQLSSKNPGRADDGGDVLAAAMLQSFCLRCTAAKLEKLVWAWKYNSFENSAHGGMELYFASAYCNHSCLPNSGWNLDDEGSFQLFADENGLAAGEEICISYLSRAHLAEATCQRRMTLADNWLFFCRCARCACDGSPICSGCGARHSVVLSGLDEGPYEPHDVDCSACGMEDLATHFGYFLHCASCEEDLCPSCGAERSPGTAPSGSQVDK